MNRTIFLGLIASSALTGCDYSGDFLFAGAIEGMEPIYHIYAEDGGDFLVPSDLCDDSDPNDDDPEYGCVGQQAANSDLIPEATIYGEISPTGSSIKGGATFYFEGNGRDVCVWVDPETAFYSQVVDENGNQSGADLAHFAYPNNTFDDGDFDLFIGKSVYYTGSPGEVIGDFVVSYTDSLGNEVPIELSECTLIGWQGTDGGPVHPGRGQPEYCTINNTEEGISYTVLMHTFATPVDDDRLGYGLLLYDGSCSDLRADAGLSHDGRDECLLLGDSVFPKAANGNGEIDFGPWFGYDPDRAWPGSEAFETTFCNAWANAADMTEYCEDEVQAKFEAGASCEWETVTDAGNRCYCGDIRDTPIGGAL
jgi:hypothetical protein